MAHVDWPPGSEHWRQLAEVSGTWHDLAAVTGPRLAVVVNPADLAAINASTSHHLIDQALVDILQRLGELPGVAAYYTGSEIVVLADPDSDAGELVAAVVEIISEPFVPPPPINDLPAVSNMRASRLDADALVIATRTWVIDSPGPDSGARLAEWIRSYRDTWRSWPDVGAPVRFEL